MDEGRGALLSAGGILSIIIGAFEVMGGTMMLLMATGIGILCRMPHVGGWMVPGGGPGTGMFPFLLWTVMAGVILVLGIVAIAGGVSAVRRRSFGLALAGAICTLPLFWLGLLAIIFVSLGRREF